MDLEHFGVALVAFNPLCVSTQRQYDTIHGDRPMFKMVTGVSTGSLIAPFAFLGSAYDQPLKDEARGKDAKPRPARMYVIHNSKTKPEWGMTEAGRQGITERALNNIIKYQGIGDLYRIYALSKLDGVDSNLAVIPEDFNVERQEEFDRNYMNQLFNLGFDLAKRGYPWMRYPPGLPRAVEAEKGIPSGKTSIRK